MNIIRSHHHEIYSEEINKVALSPNDDKRIILSDGISTLAHGHYKSRVPGSFKCQYILQGFCDPGTLKIPRFLEPGVMGVKGQ